LKLIYNNLADGYKVEDGYYPIIPVWFNAWMYKRENQAALFPILATIAKEILDKHGED
jgi:hypothetical protein